MRADHVQRGMRVVVTGGKPRGSGGIVRSAPKRQGRREYSVYKSRCEVKLDTGETVRVLPRWLEEVV